MKTYNLQEVHANIERLKAETAKIDQATKWFPVYAFIAIAGAVLALSRLFV